VSELPSGTVTFLFTDIEGSTRLWEEHPDAMREALARHDDLVRETIESHGGYVVKTTGDGFHAAFGTADAGLVAAVAAQRALVGETWPLPEPLRVRMGLHTGAASQRDGDYFGASLNRAARLMGVAHGGQIVCSQAMADLARDSAAEGTTLADLGEHRLRDLSRAERVFQVCASGLRWTSTTRSRSPSSASRPTSESTEELLRSVARTPQPRATPLGVELLVEHRARV